uniref:Uncharacterized protein n=1 Tax=Marseillevirus LCMAC101 TaxID=2506602 RepID=A0A481YUM6_9VIRU|nr:MAG: hypothetical protein LCMAC101_08010 [Marseillevirus LCMAC101]
MWSCVEGCVLVSEGREPIQRFSGSKNKKSYNPKGYKTLPTLQQLTKKMRSDLTSPHTGANPQHIPRRHVPTQNLDELDSDSESDVDSDSESEVNTSDSDSDSD